MQLQSSSMALRLRPVTAAVLTAFACGAFAQTATPAPAVRSSATLPEVKVTDTPDGSTEGTYTAPSVSIGKTGQSVRETPQSISVITRQQLDDRQITKLEDAVKFTTGIVVTRLDGAGNYNQIVARGFQIGAVQLDGIPISQGANYATAFDTAIYDRIEVLRGPAGLLQGGGEPGGAINLVRKRALNTLKIGANVSAGSFGMRRADVDLTGPLNASGSLRGRIVAVTDRRDSHVDTLFNNKTLGYGTLELDITSSTTLSVGYTNQRIRATVDQGLPTYADGRLIDAPRSTFAGLRANRQDLDSSDAFIELQHKFDNGGLLKLSARDVDRSSLYKAARANSAASANGDYQVQTVDYQQKNTDRNYDLYYTGPVQLFGRTHRVLVGASRLSGDNLGGNLVYGPSYTANLFRPNYELPYPVLTLPGYQSVTTKTENAVYGQAQIAATDKLKFIAGGRLSWAEVETSGYSNGVVTSTTNPGRKFIPLVAAIYDLNDSLSAYTSYSETFVVQTELDAAGKLLPPRNSKQVELGLKGEFLHKRLQSHFALFRIEDENRAIADPVVPTASVPGGKVRSQGLEAEVSGQVAPGWEVLAGYAFTDTKYLQAPVAQVGQVFATTTPRHMVNLFSRYAFRTQALRGLSVGGGVSWRSEFYAQSGTMKIASGNYTLVNAQIAYQFNDHLSLSLIAENLLDKTYYEKVANFGRQNFYGEPRRAVLTLTARY